MAVFGAPLTDRQLEILLAVVREHVRTREPVGSRVVQERYAVAASTATIRNEMVELEEGGFLHQPHTSAGRVPRDPAYRLYVNVWCQAHCAEPRPTPWSQGEYRRLGGDPHELLRATSRLLARATTHPAVVIKPPPSQPRLSDLALHPVSAQDVMFSYVTDNGEQRRHLLRTAEPVTAGMLSALATVLRKLHLGQRVATLASLTHSAAQSRLPDEIVPPSLIAALREAVESDDASAVYVDGASYILDEPEFQERSRLREFMRTLDEDAALRQVMREATETNEVTVTIGAEHRLPGMQACSLVASGFIAPGGRGAVGVLGPTRMDYPQLMAMVQFAARQLTTALTPPVEREE